MWLKTMNGNWVNMDYVETVLPSGSGAELMDHQGASVGYITEEHRLMLDKLWTKEFEFEFEWMQQDAGDVPCG